MVLDHRGQSRESLCGQFAGHAGTYHSASDHLRQDRRIAFFRLRACAMSKAITESNDDVIFREGRQFRRLPATAGKHNDKKHG